MSITSALMDTVSAVRGVASHLYEGVKRHGTKLGLGIGLAAMATRQAMAQETGQFDGFVSHDSGTLSFDPTVLTTWAIGVVTVAIGGGIVIFASFYGLDLAKRALKRLKS